MPIDIKDLDNEQGVIILGYGILTGKEYINALKSHLSQSDAKFKKYRYSLSDYTKVTQLDVSSSDVGLVAKLCEKASVTNPNIVVAVVADNDITFGMSRMWEILSDKTNWGIMVFRKREDAEKWIK